MNIKMHTNSAHVQWAHFHYSEYFLPYCQVNVLSPSFILPCIWWFDFFSLLKNYEYFKKIKLGLEYSMIVIIIIKISFSII